MTDGHLGTAGEAMGNAGAEPSGAAPTQGPFPQYGQYAPLPETDLNPPATNGDQPVRQLTREMAQRMRQMENEGVPMWLDRTGREATVKALAFADRTMLAGIDPHLQAEITAGFNARGITRSGGNANITFGDLLRGVGNEERLANAVCCAGFISPRLTLLKSEADLANDPDVWWVNDVHIADRRKYCNFVLGMDDEEAKRVTNLLRDRVSSSGDI